MRKVNTVIDNCKATIEFKDMSRFGKHMGYAEVSIYRNDGLTNDIDNGADGIESWSVYKLNFDDRLFVHNNDIPEVYEKRYPNGLRNGEWCYHNDDCWDHMLNSGEDAEYEHTIDTIVFMIESNIKANRQQPTESVIVIDNKTIDKLPLEKQIELLENKTAELKVKKAKIEAEKAMRKMFERELIKLEQKFAKTGNSISRSEYVSKLFG